MSKVQQNKRTIERAFKAFEKAIDKYMIDFLTDVASRSLELATDKNLRTFDGFTGNTQTSYACGIYKNGKCVRIVLQENWTQPPLRRKIDPGHSLYLENPYEGKERWVRAKKDIYTDGDYGQNTSVRFLRSYSKTSKDGWGLVMTTGTEYSEYLEVERGLDVLTKISYESEKLAKAMVDGNSYPMPAEWQ